MLVCTMLDNVMIEKFCGPFEDDDTVGDDNDESVFNSVKVSSSFTTTPSSSNQSPKLVSLLVLAVLVTVDVDIFFSVHNKCWHHTRL